MKRQEGVDVIFGLTVISSILYNVSSKFSELSRIVHNNGAVGQILNFI